MSPRPLSLGLVLALFMAGCAGDPDVPLPPTTTGTPTGNGDGGGRDGGAGGGTPSPSPTPLPSPGGVSPTPDGSGNGTGGGSAGDGSGPLPRLRLEPWLSDLDAPVLVTHAGGEEIFIVEQGGRILAYRGDKREVALAIWDRVGTGGERGLLGLAFPPGEDGLAYVSYTDKGGDSVLSRFRREGVTFDPASEEVLLRVGQPYSNHNGGHLAFGPDGMLYYGLGDGGNFGDPQNNGQDPHALLGSLLRLDVSGATGYAVPADNPYADGRDGAREVWAKGLRNPWRFSFDRQTGDLWIGDVGQGEVEEIDFVAAGTPGGLNFGWAVYEGSQRYRSPHHPLLKTYSEPVPPYVEYSHGAGECSVTGGYVYRGEASPSARGVYVFGDYCSGRIWGLRVGEKAFSLLADTDLRISSFGEDAKGELYVVGHGGTAQRLVWE